MLVPALSYTDMEIQDGAVASSAYVRMITDHTSESERSRIRDALLAYCARDTEAMVGVYEALKSQMQHSRR